MENNLEKCKVLFMGTPDFAREHLKAVIEKGYDVVGVVTQPDKPKGRGHKMLPTPVKELAMENDIPVFQPETLKNFAFLECLENLEPDIILVVAYGKLLPEYVLNFPKYGCVNIHGSLLPKYRGAAPIQHSILCGEKYAGVTAMFMARGMDTGDIVLQKSIEIDECDTSESLYLKLAPVGCQALLECLELIIQGKANATVQNEDEATYAPMLEKDMAKIDWNNSAWHINCQIRGLNPWPIAYTIYECIKVKIFASKIIENADELLNENIALNANGTVLAYVKKTGLLVKTGDGVLAIKQVQFEGGKAMDIDSYMLGHKIENGVVLG